MSKSTKNQQELFWAAPQTSQEFITEIEKNALFQANSNRSAFLGEHQVFDYKVKGYPQLIHSHFRPDINDLGKIDSPFAVAVKGFFKYNDIKLVVKDFVDNLSLREFMKYMRKRIPEKILSQITLQLLHLLRYLNKMGLYHGDLNPDLISLNVRGIISVIDCGLCEKLEERGLVRDTHYMPPEFVLDHRTDAKSDIWSLGILLAELALCEYPIPQISLETKSDFEKIREIVKNKLSSNSSSFSDDFISFIEKCLSFEAEDRPNAENLLNHAFIQNYNINCEDILQKLNKKEVPEFPEIENWYSNEAEEDQDEKIIKIGKIWSLKETPEDFCKAIQNGEIEMLGKGGYAQVYKVFDYAVKIVARNPSSIKEAMLLQNIDCQFSVRFFGAFAMAERLFIIMEYVDFGSLEQFSAIPESTLSQITLQLLYLLALLKKLKIMHRDIKPANVFLSSEGIIKVGDFGVSKQSSCSFMTAKGTPQYMAPERINLSKYSFSADIWSLGITIAELAIGNYPVESSVYKGNNQFFIDEYYLHKFQSDLEQLTILDQESNTTTPCSSELKDFLKQCCRYQPEDRASPEALMFHPFILKHNGNGGRMETIEKLLKKLSDAHPNKKVEFVHIRNWLHPENAIDGDEDVIL